MNISILFFLVILAAIGLLFLKWLTKYTDVVFWTSLLFYFDPGGFFAGLFTQGLLARLKPYDIFFVLMMVAWRASGYWKIQTNFRIHKQFLAVFIVYCIYFLLVYGYFVPAHYGYDDFMLFLQKHRHFFYCPLLFLAVYQFGYMSINKLMKPLIYTALLMFFAFFFTMVTGIELVPILKFTRFIEEDRVALISYGLSHWLLPFALISIFIRKKIPENYQRMLLLAAGLMLITIVLTLTRREFIRILFMLMAVPFLTSYISGSSFAPGYKKMMKFMVLPIIILVLFFPVYIDLSIKTLENILGFLNIVEVDKSADYRVSGQGDLVFVKQIIADHPIMGIGYYPAPWGEILEMKASGSTLALALDASSEVQIFGSTMRLGFVGLIIPALIHFAVIFLILRSLKVLKSGYGIIKSHPFELLLALTIIYFLITLFTTELFSLFVEFYHPVKFATYTVMLALLQAILARQNFRIYKLKNSDDSIQNQ